MNTPKKFAVLIDADNSSTKKIPAILQEVAKYGIASVKRIYGDWSSERLNAWRDVLLPHAITPIQQFAYPKGKDATDMMLIINAMDLLYSGALDGFCIVSSDSDFTPLASRIRESGLLVYGFGENKTPKAFINACDKFIYIENLEGSISDITQDNSKPEKPQPKTNPPLLPPKNSTPATPKTTNTNTAQTANKTGNDPKDHKTPNPTKPIDEPTLQLIYKAIKDTADDDGWSNLSVLGNHLTIIKPDFDTRTYGRAKLSGLLKLLDVFEIKQEGSQKYVRKRPSFGKFLKVVDGLIKTHYGIGQWAQICALVEKIDLNPSYYDVHPKDYGCQEIQELFDKIDSKYFEFNQDKTKIRLVPPKETS